MSFKFYRYWDNINSTHDVIWVERSNNMHPSLYHILFKDPSMNIKIVVVYIYSIFSLFLMLLSKWQMIFCETVTIIYDLGPGIKLLLPHFTLLPWPSNFYFYRAIYFKERTKIYWIQHVRSKKKYFGVPSYAERIQICSRMLLDVVECHIMQIPSETEGKNGPFRFEFLSNSVKKCW